MPKKPKVWNRNNNNNKLTLKKHSNLNYISRKPKYFPNGFRDHKLFCGDHLPRVTREKVKKFLNSDLSDRLAMAVEFDHLFIGCNDSKAAIGKDIQVDQLKDMLILNLELIEHQTEQLDIKDQIIKSLKEENQNLKAKLERIDRRVSLSHHKRPLADSVTTPLKVDITDYSTAGKLCKAHSPFKHSSPKVVKDVSPPIRVTKNENKCDLSSNKGAKHETSKKTLSPKTFSPKISSPRSPRERRVTREQTAKETLIEALEKCFTPSEQTAPLETESCRRLRTPVSKRRSEAENDPTPKRAKGGGLFNDFLGVDKMIELEEGATNHSLRSRDKVKESPKVSIEPISSPITTPDFKDTVKECLSPDSLKAKNLEPYKSNSNSPQKEENSTDETKLESLLNTPTPYLVASQSKASPSTPPTTESSKPGIVETPQWRYRVLTSLYIMEGTENLEDEIFLKRHSKPEHEEKRRKRWDLQRMREQRQYEKLKERYEGRQNASDHNNSASISLWPHPESVIYLHVEDTLPVCAFGQPLAELDENEFFLPWLQSQPNGVSTRRRKR